jgi:hypothetical protein
MITDRIARGLVGSAVMFGGAALYNMGKVTAGEGDDYDTTAYNRGIGNLTNAIKIGDQWYPLSRYQPAVSPFSLGVELASIKEGDITADAISALLAAGGTALNYYTDLQMLQTFEKIAGGGYQNETIGERVGAFALELPRQFVPTVLNQIRKATDENQRETYADTKFMEKTVNPIINKIPILSATLPKKYSQEGKELLQSYGNNNIFNSFFSTGVPSKYKPDEIQKEVVRLADAGYTRHVPNRVAKYIPPTKDYARINFTGQQYSDYQRDVGTEIAKVYNKVINNRQYKQLDDAQKEDLLSEYQSKAKTEVTNYYRRKYGEAPKLEKLK